MKSKAAVLHEPTESHDFLDDQPARIETVTVDDPTGEQVLVEIAAASLCHTDVAAAVGNTDEPKPVVMGHEGAGVVRSVGEDVTSVSVGDHVVLGRITCGRCEHCREGWGNLCLERRSAGGRLRTGGRGFTGPDGSRYYHYHGVSSFTEFTLVTEDVAIPITDELPLEQGSLLGCGIFTGVGAVANTADVEPGTSVAVFGAGGVGLSAIQGAVLRGAQEIIAVDLVKEKLDIAERVGATHTVNTSEVDPVERIQELTETGVNYAFDMVGHPSVVEQAVASLDSKGTAVLVGTPAEAVNDFSLNHRELVLGERRIIGSFNGSYSLPTAIPMLAELVADGRLSLDEMITNTRSLDELNEAMVALESGPEVRQLISP